jgi:hypothetical protein
MSLVYRHDFKCARCAYRQTFTLTVTGPGEYEAEPRVCDCGELIPARVIREAYEAFGKDIVEVVEVPTGKETVS